MFVHGFQTVLRLSILRYLDPVAVGKLAHLAGGRHLNFLSSLSHQIIILFVHQSFLIRAMYPAQLHFYDSNRSDNVANYCQLSDQFVVLEILCVIPSIVRSVFLLRPILSFSAVGLIRYIVSVLLYLLEFKFELLGSIGYKKYLVFVNFIFPILYLLTG